MLSSASKGVNQSPSTVAGPVGDRRTRPSNDVYGRRPPPTRRPARRSSRPPRRPLSRTGELVASHPEGCQSGRMGRPRKPLWPPGHRGFESHTFRVGAQVSQHISTICWRPSPASKTGARRPPSRWQRPPARGAGRAWRPARCRAMGTGRPLAGAAACLPSIGLRDPWRYARAPPGLSEWMWKVPR